MKLIFLYLPTSEETIRVMHWSMTLSRTELLSLHCRILSQMSVNEMCFWRWHSCCSLLNDFENKRFCFVTQIFQRILVIFTDPVLKVPQSHLMMFLHDNSYIFLNVNTFF